ncbi:hydroxyproline-rich systemin A precursor [Nicotiana tabacum]|uniref:Hydroxyproline-rich systemin A precursor n=1 Tax=Nicotiana tabacum TaxID=4097 RepID=A0ABD8EX93_TOBAC|nr:hydroxyproline-rich systemin A precursor [Nicotiana tabacum]XP_009598525.1 hydroxyproline-rich systemin A [Nicotiana tomentosiformis]
MRVLFLIYLILSPFGAEARTLLENHEGLNVGSGYGRGANLPPPSPASSPPSKEVSNSVSPTRTDEKTSENTELVMTTIAQGENINQLFSFPTSADNYYQLASFKKLFISYLLPVSYVWNLIGSSSFDHDLVDIFDTKSDERYWNRKPLSPPSPKPADGQRPLHSY